MEREFRAAGRRLAYRPSRDEDVRLADGVILFEGEFPGRGDCDPGIVLEVRDVPTDQAARMVEAYKATILDGATLNREALLAERAKLLARVAEIDAALAEEN
jgi:hypothetical protein